MKKSERIQMILMLIKQNKRMTAKDLSDYLEVSMRTIYRDIDALSQMNVPIIAYEGLHGGYEIDHKYFIPTIRLWEKEILILMLLLKVSKKLSLPDFTENISALDIKLRNACYGEVEDYKDVLDRITFDMQYIYAESYLEGTFEKILMAFKNNEKLAIQYFVPLKNQMVDRKISPLHLFYSEGCWYLDAFCHLRLHKRTFRLDRIRSISLTSEKVDKDLHKKYKEKDLDDPSFLLEFQIDKDLYSLIKDDGAMKEAIIYGSDDRHYYIRIETNKRVYFETLAIRNVSEVTIKSPEFFVELIKDKFIEAMKKYS
ncbi:helix-turn-helix transcriptional regulator [Alkaliphilus transvaalensis]|uniref:helix-turn-helix transcriptional regulator n=1 Tax=Alkaliphilus transvaalensis TaxID=114628 RepID=UPI00047EF6C7|nr:WYL domain-containing protein [Alkaliphilus transvaalensis]